jgi:hypothetical protein
MNKPTREHKELIKQRAARHIFGIKARKSHLITQARVDVEHNKLSIMTPRQLINKKCALAPEPERE